PERSLFFWFYNAGKRGITLDWRRPEGAERLRRLAAGADVLIESEPPGALAARSCGPESLRALNPRLIVASITPLGQTGPYRDWWVMHCTLGDWTSLVEWMKADGTGAELDDPGLEDIRTRQAEADRLFAALDAWAARYTVEDLVRGAQLRRIPYAAVRPPEALLRDAHLAERGFFVPIEHPDLGLTVPYPGAPFRLA